MLRYLIDERSSLTLEYTHQYAQMNVIGSNYAFSSRGYGDLPPNFTTAEPNLEPSRIHENNLLGSFEHRFNDQWQFTAQVAYIHYNQVGQSLWPWGIAPNDSLMQRGISIWDALGINQNGQMFVNGSVRTGGITHNFLGGIDMSHKDYYADWNQGGPLGDSTFNIYAPVYGQVPAAAIPHWDRTLDVRERGVRYHTTYQALYVQDELGFFDNKVRLTLGGRYTLTKNVNPYSGNTDDGKFTPRAGLSVSLADQTSAYVLYDQAFLPNPGIDWQGNGFDPVTGNNLEAGLKKDWFGGRWNTVVSVYQITKNNVLTTDMEHPDPTTGQFIYSRQTGQQQVKGVEVDLRGELMPNLSAVINYAYTDAVITRDADPAVVGSRIPGATRHIHNAWLNYHIGVGDFSGLVLSLGYQYQAGRSSWFIFDDSEAALPDYFRLDGGISYRNERFNANLIWNNLLNDYLYSGAPYGGTFYWQTEPLLDVRLTVGYRF